MLRKADIGTFKADIARFGDDAKFRLEGGKLTTAERGLGGRIARFFTGVTKQDRADNAQIKGQLFKALKDQYGADIATQAFRTALGTGVKVKDGGLLVATNHRLTAREVRAAIDQADKLVANNRTQSAVTAYRYTPGSHDFRLLAHDAGVDPSRLSRTQKEFITERVMSLVSQRAHSDRYADGVVDRDAAKKIAKDVIRQADALGDDGIAELRQRYDAAADAGEKLMVSIGDRSSSARTIARDLADATRATNALPKEDSYFGGSEGLGADDFKTATDVSLRQAAGRLSHTEASDAFKAVMAPDGQGRALLFALGALSELPGIGHDPYAGAALEKLTNAGKQLLISLGLQGGHRVDQNDVVPLMASAEKVKWSPDGQTLTIPREVLARAGISDEGQVHDLVAQLRQQVQAMGRDIEAEMQIMNEAIARQRDGEGSSSI
jgi:hypothetical protein